MAINIKIDQLRIAQLIAEGNGYPGKLFVLSNKTDGTSNNDGTINDNDFYNEANASDTFFVVSGSKFNVRSPNAIDGESNGVVLFTGDVVMSASLVVSTDQRTLYTPILAISSAFIGNKDLAFAGVDFGYYTNNSLFAANNQIALQNNIYYSTIQNSDAVYARNLAFVNCVGLLSTSINSATNSIIHNAITTDISSVYNSCIINSVGGAYNTLTLGTSIGEIACSSTGATYGFFAGNMYSVASNINGATSIGNYNTNIGILGGGSSLFYPGVAIGNSNGIMRVGSGSFIISSDTSAQYGNRSGIIGGSNAIINSYVSNSLALFANNVIINDNNKIVIGTDIHTTWLSGSLVAQKISGSHTLLADGLTPAFTTFSTQSGPTHTNTSSSGQVQYGIMTRIGMGNYISSTATSSIPEIAGTAYMNQYEHEDVLGITGSYAKFRCILSTATSSTTAYVKLWNVSDSGYVQIGGPGVYSLSTTSSSPTALVSSDLTNATLGFSMSNKVYEVHVYISGSGLPAIVNHHKSELLFAPKTLNGYS